MKGPTFSQVLGGYEIFVGLNPLSFRLAIPYFALSLPPFYESIIFSRCVQLLTFLWEHMEA